MVPPTQTQSTQPGSATTPSSVTNTAGHRYCPWTGNPLFTQSEKASDPASAPQGEDDDVALLLTDEEPDAHHNSNQEQYLPKKKKAKKPRTHAMVSFDHTTSTFLEAAKNDDVRILTH